VADVATLNVLIDSSGVRVATNDIKVWNAEVSRAEKSTGATARAMSNVNENTRLTSGVLSKATADVVKFDSRIGKLNGKLAQAATSLVAVNERTTEKPRSTEAINKNASTESNLSTPNFSRLGGGSKLNFVTSHAQDAGTPFVETDTQRALKGLSWILQKVGPLSSRQEVAGVAAESSDFFKWLADNTNDNKLIEIRDEVNKTYETTKKEMKNQELQCLNTGGILQLLPK
jgi:hypothetical protein